MLKNNYFPPLKGMWKDEKVERGRVGGLREHSLKMSSKTAEVPQHEKTGKNNKKKQNGDGSPVLAGQPPGAPERRNARKSTPQH